MSMGFLFNVGDAWAKKYLERMRLFARGIDLSDYRKALDECYRGLALMGLPHGDRKKLIKDLANQIQDDIDDDVASMIKDITEGEVELPMGGEIEITHAFPLYIGAYSGNGLVSEGMEAVNEVFRKLHERVLHNETHPNQLIDTSSYERIRQFICHSINAWSQSRINKPFTLKIRMDNGVEREFVCAMVEIMMQDASVELQECTPLRMRLKVKTAVPDYLEQIERNGKFYLIGWLDMDTQGRWDLMEITGLGYHELRYDRTNGQAVPMNKQILL